MEWIQKCQVQLFDCLFVVKKGKVWGCLALKENHGAFYFVPRCFLDVIFSEGAICVASFKVWKRFSVGLLQTLLENI